MFLSSLEVGDLNGTPPSVPVNISVSTGDRLVSIGWDPPEDTGNLRLRGFRVYRGTTHDELAIISQVSPDRTFFTDRTLTMGQEYHYAISALNGIGEGKLEIIR